MQITIRETNKRDFPRISKVLRETELAKAWFTKSLFQKMLIRNRGLYVVAVVEGKVVGTVFSTHDGGYCGYIYKLAVLPQYRQIGIGSRLLREAQRRLRKIKIRWHFAHIEKTNRASSVLLKKFGIRPRHKYDFVDNFVPRPRSV